MRKKPTTGPLNILPNWYRRAGYKKRDVLAGEMFIDMHGYVDYIDKKYEICPSHAHDAAMQYALIMIH